ncbi:16S rRNA (guanine(966)-N(2))-methyltransferase RsmD [Insolitispirillum peregrinum]|uniref:16S rRNA (guanine(966)-N(2))-methyltransferase RsmD n=1 Tax=Insolitispirillum peregrinum TaxID=80876 RepID=UPI0036122AC4
MRIVGGDFRGKPLVAPEGRDSVRPTSDRARESVFNVLMHNHFGSLDGVRVLDVFAGTGALGLEALSRGAAHVVFFERGGPAVAALKANIAALKVERRTTLVFGDATTPPLAGKGSAGELVFLDPPYEAGVLVPTLEALARRGWLADGAVVVCEQHFATDLEPPAGFEVLDERRYGKAKVTFLSFHATPPVA